MHIYHLESRAVMLKPESEISPARRHRHNVRVPVVIRPNPPPPMSVAVAVRVFGAETLVALIRYYRLHPGHTQKQAAAALGLDHRQIGRDARTLVQAAVLTEVAVPSDRRARAYVLDRERAEQLHLALRTYLFDERPGS